jgi:Zn-dependent metalloprotease
VIGTLLLWALLGQTGLDAFTSAFPAAETSVSPSGGRLTHASGFRVDGLGDTPEAAARAFLTRHGAAFGIGADQRLLLTYATQAGTFGAVRFSRHIGGLPVFDGGVTVGVDAQGGVVLVNAGDVPEAVSGRFRISKKTAVARARAAFPGLETADTPRADRGWRGAGKTVRPVWRVDFMASHPPGDWRTFVDADTGKVIQRMNLRVFGSGP